MPAIRLATVDDVAGLARLRYEFRSTLATATESETAFRRRCESWMASRLARRDDWMCWMAVDDRDERIAGSIWLQIIEKLPNPVNEPERHGYITSFFVQEHMRGAGVGSRLLSAALEASGDCKCDSVILWPTPRSRVLYERHGFTSANGLMELRLRKA
jgi:GNAT superfamily N-acetyltransferase